jgi:hypothetical protein
MSNLLFNIQLSFITRAFVNHGFIPLEPAATELYLPPHHKLQRGLSAPGCVWTAWRWENLFLFWKIEPQFFSSVFSLITNMAKIFQLQQNM